MSYDGNISAEQMADILADREEWMRTARMTERCDRPAAEEAIRAVYHAAELEEPKIVLWFDSPFSGAYAAAMLSKLGKTRPQVRDEFQMGDIDAARLQLWEQLLVPLREDFDSSICDSLREQFIAQSRNLTWDEMTGWLDQIFGTPSDDQADWNVTKVLNGSLSIWYEAYWLCFYRNAFKIAEIPEPEKLTTLIEATKTTGWWWPMRNIVVATDRPTILSVDSQGQLHNTGKPAIQYADGYSLWAWHGTRVTQDIIEGRLSAEDILRLPNAEVRRCAIEVRGWDWFIEDAGLQQVGPTVADPGNPGQFLTLYDVPEQVYEEPVRVLLCTNGTEERDGTRRRFGLTVPAEISDPIAAAAWGYGDDDHPIAVTPEMYAQLARRC